MLGGQVAGGRLFGTWPGLAAGAAHDHADLAITTDYRRILAEILGRRMGNPIGVRSYPGYAGYTPLGIVGSGIFSDGFENGRRRRLVTRLA